MQAATIPCPGNSTLASLIALGSGPGNGCTVDDMLFNNFSYTPSAGAPASSGINASLDDNPIALVEGFTFTVPGLSFDGNFSLGYTATVVACATCKITSVTEQLLAAQNPPSAPSISVVETAGLSPLVISNASFANNTNGDSFPGVTAVTKAATATGISAPDSLLSFESDIRQTNTPILSAPEPATLSLLGLSFLGLGYLRRRARS
jgi:hypothetical protein